MEQNEEDDDQCCDFNGNRNPATGISGVCVLQYVLETCQEGSSSLTSPASSKENESSDSATENKQLTDTQKLAQKLRKELEDLQFRTSYEWQRSDGKIIKINTNPLFDASYPQPRDDFQPTHMSHYDPKLSVFASTSVSGNGNVSF